MRPPLNQNIDPDLFLDYYWLKEELIAFCKSYKIPLNGSKETLTKRIYTFLKTGTILTEKKPQTKPKPATNVKLTLTSTIPVGYKNDERQRQFFISIIGPHFKFNVSFMNWMKQNAGKTYQDAVDEWNRIWEEKKSGNKTAISPQFEYNQYTRDFFKANPNRSRDEAITCWKYKKSLQGHNKYEDSDLSILVTD
jgi:hypothetical protein